MAKGEVERGGYKDTGEGGGNTPQRHMMIHNMGAQLLVLERWCSSLMTRRRPQGERGRGNPASLQARVLDTQKRSVRVGDNAVRCKQPKPRTGTA